MNRSLRCRINDMRVFSLRTLREFWEQHPEAETPLRTWFRNAERTEWNNLSEVKTTYPHADLVGNFTVFNIGGNKYRLIVRVDYQYKRVFIRAILTHPEYDQGDWKE